MSSDVLDGISKTSNILGLWTIVGIIIFLIICLRSICYVGYVVCPHNYTVLTRASARYTISAALAEGEFKASKMKYDH